MRWNSNFDTYRKRYPPFDVNSGHFPYLPALEWYAPFAFYDLSNAGNTFLFQIGPDQWLPGEMNKLCGER